MICQGPSPHCSRRRGRAISYQVGGGLATVVGIAFPPKKIIAEVQLRRGLLSGARGARVPRPL